MATGSCLSTITLNVNGLNAPTKRQRLAEWIQKQDPYICCLQETQLKTGDTYGLKVKGWKKIFHANRDPKKAGVAILISVKIDFKTKAVKIEKEGHYIMIKGSVQEEDTTIINIYTPNIAALQYIRQKLSSMKGKINNNTIIVGDCHEPAQEIPPMTRSCGRELLSKASGLKRLPRPAQPSSPKPESVCLTILCLSPTLLTYRGPSPTIFLWRKST